jgi:hypothetical protein
VRTVRVVVLDVVAEHGFEVAPSEDPLAAIILASMYSTQVFRMPFLLRTVIQGPAIAPKYSTARTPEVPHSCCYAGTPANRSRCHR